jgi:hypothetical protein
MSDYLAAVADDLDREPECRCVDTLRGLDRAGCPRHDPDYPESEPDENLAMIAYSSEATNTARRPWATTGPARRGAGGGSRGMRPTTWQRQILSVLAAGGKVTQYEGESGMCIVDSDGAWWGRLHGGMRHRMTRDGWLKRGQITDAGRAAIAARPAATRPGQEGT